MGERKNKSGTIIGTTAKAPYGYGECPACGHKNVHLAEDGTLADPHGSTKLGTGRCPGSGERPVQTGMTGQAHMASDFPLWLCSFLDKNKRVIDHITYRAVSRDDARRRAVEMYLQNGDKALYAGFVVNEEKHGGY